MITPKGDDEREDHDRRADPELLGADERDDHALEADRPTDEGIDQYERGELWKVLPKAKTHRTRRGTDRVYGFSPWTLTPCTPNLRATRSFDVPPKGSKCSVIRTAVNPTASSTDRSSASGRAPAIQPVHRSISRLIVSDSSLATTMSA